jgi:hypothetical protein
MLERHLKCWKGTPRLLERQYAGTASEDGMLERHPGIVVLERHTRLLEGHFDQDAGKASEMDDVGKAYQSGMLGRHLRSKCRENIRDLCHSW